ncbi:hypothetical protein RB213_016271, partial [Colletotrichum asianum]
MVCLPAHIRSPSRRQDILSAFNLSPVSKNITWQAKEYTHQLNFAKLLHITISVAQSRHPWIRMGCHFPSLHVAM